MHFRELQRAWESDLLYSFRHSPITVFATLFFLTCLLGAAVAPFIHPHNACDLKTLNLLESLLPPAWLPEGKSSYPLGTDNQGRGVLSTIMYGTRISLHVGLG